MASSELCRVYTGVDSGGSDERAEWMLLLTAKEVMGNQQQAGPGGHVEGGQVLVLFA